MHKQFKKITLAVLCAPLISAYGGGDPLDVTQGIVIQNATVVNTRDGSLALGRAVVLDGGKIVWVGPNEAVRLSGTAQAVDATGKFVVPGFVDMHIHAMVRSTQTPSYFPLMLANGITGFREMGEFQGSFPNMVARAVRQNA